MSKKLRGAAASGLSFCPSKGRNFMLWVSWNEGGNSPVFSACCLSGGASTLPVGAGWRKSSQTSQHLLPRIEPLPGMIRNGASCPSWSNSAALEEYQGKREPWVDLASQTPMELHVAAQMPLTLTVLHGFSIF